MIMTIILSTIWWSFVYWMMAERRVRKIRKALDKVNESNDDRGAALCAAWRANHYLWCHYCGTALDTTGTDRELTERICMVMSTDRKVTHFCCDPCYQKELAAMKATERGQWTEDQL
jgi:hypothetical protein